MKKIILFIIYFLFFISTAKANDAAQIELQINKNSVVVGDSFQISVSLKNASTNNNIDITNIKIPGIENFQQVGSSRSTQIQMINGVTTATTNTVLNFVSLAEGDYDIGPIEIKIGTLEVKSNIVHIKVNKKTKKSFFGNINNSDKLKISFNKQEDKNNNIDIKKMIINFLAFILLVVFVYIFLKQKQADSNFYSEQIGAKNDRENKISLILTDVNDKDFFIKTKKRIINYLQNKYHLELKGLTSNEIISLLEKSNIRDVNIFKKVLAFCDQGNFARKNNLKEELLKTINLINKN